MDQLTVAIHNQKMELWIGRIRECRTSGMTVSEWCHAQAISIKTYYYWLHKIKREAFDSLPAKQSSKAAVDTPVSPFVELPVSQIRSDTAIRVHLSHAVVDIPDGTSAASIQQVLKSLNQIC